MKKWIFVFLFGLLASCGQSSSSEALLHIPKDWTFPHVVVLPHHGLTAKSINAFYEQLAKQSVQYDRIVIISPDHFASTSHAVESFPRGLQTSCFQGFCVPLATFAEYNFASSRVFQENGKIIEHGFGEHFSRIAKYFPDIPVTPILLRRGNSASIFEKKLLQQLIDLAKKEKILVIASVDFSHHVPEEFATFHDKKSIVDLNSDRDIFGAEVDCKNCLWLARALAHHFGQTHFALVDRTSVDSILGTNSGYENTSHVLWFFASPPHNHTKNSARYVLFLSEKSFDHSVIARLYQYWQRKNNPRQFVHRITHGFDEVFVLGNTHKDASKYSLFDAKKVTPERLLPYGVTITEDNGKIRIEWKGMSHEVRVDTNVAVLCEIFENDFSCTHSRISS